MMKRIGIAALALLWTAFAAAGYADDGKQQQAKRPLTDADAVAGKSSYLRECSGCHGDRGNGTGPAADYVDPRPRDFTTRKFKLRTTKSPLPPTTADILRTIERGIPGTAMPSFAFLPETERKQITAYVLKLADLLDEPEPKPFDVPRNIPPTTPEMLAKGKAMFADAGCVSCHGLSGKGDGTSAKDLKDTNGRPIKPRDLTIGDFRGGSERADIYNRLITGMEGTPMPSYDGALEEDEMWAVVDYVLALRQPPVAKPRPAEPVAAGREVAAKYSCGGCHILDDGKGGEVGPDFRVSGQKLDSSWVRTFLKAPRDYGKIYPWRIYRMPHLPLTDEEIEVMAKYFAAVGKRQGPIKLPDPSTFTKEKLAEGQLIFMLRCTECHNLGNVIETPPVKQQGPDLIRVARRVDYDWAKNWILNPRKIDPKTRMIVPDITPEQVDAVRMFVWKSAIEASKTTAAPQNAVAASH